MTDLKNLKKVKSFNIDEFDGMNVKIGEVILMDVEQKDFGDGLKEVRQIRILTENLSKEGQEEIKAGEYVGLKKDLTTGEWGYPDGSNSKAMKVLNYFKVNSFDELIGKKCMVVKRVNDNKEFLGIHFG